MEKVHRRDPRVVPKEPKNILRIRHLAESESWNSPEIERQWVSKKLYTIVVKCVCAECNNGWMSEIEGKAKAILEPMIEGKVVELDAEAQATISTWTCLRAIVGYYAHETNRPIPDDWLAHIYEHKTPPDNWFIWTTAYDGNTPTRFQSTEIGLVPKGENPHIAELDHGVVTSLLIGYLALKVFGLRHATPPEPGADGALRIWPTSPLIYIWPPPAYLDDSVTDFFFEWGMQGSSPVPPKDAQ